MMSMACRAGPEHRLRHLGGGWVVCTLGGEVGFVPARAGEPEADWEKDQEDRP